MILMRISNIYYTFAVENSIINIFKMRMLFNPQNYKFSIGEHHDKKVIFVSFPYNLQWQQELKEKFPTAKWSMSLKCWYLPDINAIRNEIGMQPKTEMGKIR